MVVNPRVVVTRTAVGHMLSIDLAGDSSTIRLMSTVLLSIVVSASSTTYQLTTTIAVEVVHLLEESIVMLIILLLVGDAPGLLSAPTLSLPLNRSHPTTMATMTSSIQRRLLSHLLPSHRTSARPARTSLQARRWFSPPTLTSRSSRLRLHNLLRTQSANYPTCSSDPPHQL